MLSIYGWLPKAIEGLISIICHCLHKKPLGLNIILYSKEQTNQQDNLSHFFLIINTCDLNRILWWYFFYYFFTK